MINGILEGPRIFALDSIRTKDKYELYFHPIKFDTFGSNIPEPSARGTYRKAMLRMLPLHLSLQIGSLLQCVAIQNNYYHKRAKVEFGIHF